MHIYQRVFWWHGTGELGSTATVPSIHNLRFSLKDTQKKVLRGGRVAATAPEDGFTDVGLNVCTAVYFFFFLSLFL